MEGSPEVYRRAERNLITYKLRLYPTRTQAKLMAETIETCKLLYNDLLDDRNANHTKCFAQKKMLTAVRKEDKFLKAVHSQVLQDVTFRLDKAYSAFFAGLSQYPKFKRKGRYNSFTYPQLGGFKIVNGKLRLSKIGLVRAKFHRAIEGTPKTCTVIRDIDQWFACIPAETDSFEPIEQQRSNSVGVDLGVINLATLSNGRTFENPRYLDNSVTRIKTLQRRLSRKLKGSNNREKAKFLLAKGLEEGPRPTA